MSQLKLADLNDAKDVILIHHCRNPHLIDVSTRSYARALRCRNIYITIKIQSYTTPQITNTAQHTYINTTTFIYICESYNSCRCEVAARDGA